MNFGGRWGTLEAIMVFDSGCRKIAGVTIVGKDKDTCGAIMITAEESLWSTEVPHLSLPFLMLLLIVIYFLPVRITSLFT